jgi:hypothetical protein
MAEKKVRKVTKSPSPQAGFKGKVTEITYNHGVKLGLGHNTYSSIEMGLWITVKLDPSDDPDVVLEMVKDRVHREIAQTSAERKQEWLEELGVGKSSHE